MKAQAASDAQGPRKVKLKRSVADEINRLNEEVTRKSPIRLAAVAALLAPLGEATALEILANLLEQELVEDPTAWIRSSAKKKAAEQAAAASAEWEDPAGEQCAATDEPDGGTEDTEQNQPEPPEHAEPDSINKWVRKLNKSDKLQAPLKLTMIAGPLAVLGFDEAVSVLKELEAKADDVENPSTWVRARANRRAGPVMTKVNQLNHGGPGKMDLLAPIAPLQVKEPLSSLPVPAAMSILQELESSILEIDDPTPWILEQVKKKTEELEKKAGGSGEVLLKLKELNSSGKLTGGLKIYEAAEAMKRLQPSVAVSLINKLEAKGAAVRNPTGFLVSEASRMNSKGLAKGKGRGVPPLAAPTFAAPTFLWGRGAPVLGGKGAAVGKMGKVLNAGKRGAEQVLSQGEPVAKRQQVASTPMPQNQDWAKEDEEAAFGVEEEGGECGEEEFVEKVPEEAAEDEDIDGIC